MATIRFLRNISIFYNEFIIIIYINNSHNEFIIKRHISILYKLFNNKNIKDIR